MYYCQIFYDIINEATRYDRKEEVAFLWEMIKDYEENPDTTHQNIIGWCEEQLDLLEIPKGAFRDSYMWALKQDDKQLEAMVEHIQMFCAPEETDE